MNAEKQRTSSDNRLGFSLSVFNVLSITIIGVFIGRSFTSPGQLQPMLLLYFPEWITAHHGPTRRKPPWSSLDEPSGPTLFVARSPALPSRVYLRNSLWCTVRRPSLFVPLAFCSDVLPWMRLRQAEGGVPNSSLAPSFDFFLCA